MDNWFVDRDMIKKETINAIMGELEYLLEDEYDEDEELLIQKVDENTYTVPGGMKLDDINDALDTDFTSEDYDSIGGLIIEKLDKLPSEGEFVTLDDGTTLMVEIFSQNRIEQVRLTLADKESDSEEESDSDNQK